MSLIWWYPIMDLSHLKSLIRKSICIYEMKQSKKYKSQPTYNYIPCSSVVTKRVFLLTLYLVFWINAWSAVEESAFYHWLTIVIAICSLIKALVKFKNRSLFPASAMAQCHSVRLTCRSFHERLISMQKSIFLKKTARFL